MNVSYPVSLETMEQKEYKKILKFDLTFNIWRTVTRERSSMPNGLDTRGMQGAGEGALHWAMCSENPHFAAPFGSSRAGKQLNDVQF